MPTRPPARRRDAASAGFSPTSSCFVATTFRAGSRQRAWAPKRSPASTTTRASRPWTKVPWHSRTTAATSPSPRGCRGNSGAVSISCADALSGGSMVSIRHWSRALRAGAGAVSAVSGRRAQRLGIDGGRPAQEATHDRPGIGDALHRKPGEPADQPMTANRHPHGLGPGAECRLVWFIADGEIEPLVAARNAVAGHLLKSERADRLVLEL